MIFLLALSLTLQFVALLLAARLFFVSGRRVGWVLIFLAILGVGWTRGTLLLLVLSGKAEIESGLSGGLVELFGSLLVSGSLFWIVWALKVPPQERRGGLDREAFVEATQSGSWGESDVWWSEEIRRIFDLSREDFVPAFQEFLHFVHPADRQHLVEAIEGALDNRDPLGSANTVSLLEMYIENHRRTTELSRLNQGLDDQVKDRTRRLVQSENRRRKAEEIADIGVFEETIGVEEIWWSKSLYRLLGLEPEELVPTRSRFLERMHPGDQEGFTSAIDDSLVLGAPLSRGFRAQHVNGEWRDFEVVGGVVRDERGRITGLRGSVSDVSGRVQVERSLRESELKYRTLVESSPFCIHQLNRQGLITSMNAAGLRMIDAKDESEVVGEPYLSAVCEEDRDQIERLMNEALAGKFVEFEFSGQREFSSNFVPIFDADGKVDRLLGITQDITEKKEAELARQESERRFRDLADLLPQIVFETDLNGKPTFLNRQAERVSGYSVGDLEGAASVLYFVAAEDRDRVIQSMLRIIEGAPTETAVATLVRKDGSTLPTSIYASSILKNGRLVGFRGIVVDDTERRNAEIEQERLEVLVRHGQKLESLGLLAGGIAHDFNNLMVGVLLEAELAEEDLDPTSDLVEPLRRIQVAAQRSSDLARELLAYAGKGELVSAVVEVNSIIHETCGLLRASISRKVALEFDLQETLPCIQADPVQIRQIVMNLITNAADAIGKESGTVTVRTRVGEFGSKDLAQMLLGDASQPGRYISIEVVDTGCGIDDDLLELLFDPFFTTKVEGRGLGMAVVLGIVRSAGGAIEVQSSPGQGASLRVLLPSLEEPREVRVSGSVESEEPLGGTVLLIDDDEVVRMVSEAALKVLGFEVLLAGDGQQGVDLFRARACEIDVVLVDKSMPIMDGEEVLAVIRDIEPDTQVILATGYAEEDTNIEGFDGFLAKPYTLSALRHVLAKALRSHQPS